MDLSTLNTKKPAEDGAWLHLCYPYKTQLMYEPGEDGKPDETRPCRVKLRGMESETVQDVLQRLNKSKMSGRKQDERKAEADGLKFAAAMVIKFENLHNGVEPLTTSAEDIKWFFDQSGDFTQQVLEFAQDNTNFLGKT